MNKTENYGFLLPTDDDFYDITTQQNVNWELADKKMKEIETRNTNTYTGTGGALEIEIGDSSGVLITCSAKGYSAIVALGAIYWSMNGSNMGQLNWLDIYVSDGVLHIDTSNEIVNEKGTVYTYQAL